MQARHARRDALILAADLLHGSRLEVEGVVVRDPAAEEDEQDGLGAGRGRAGERLVGKEVGERQPERCERADAEEVAAGNAVAQRRTPMG